MAENEMDFAKKAVEEQEHDNNKTMADNETDVTRSPEDETNEMGNTVTNQMSIRQYLGIYENHISIH